MTQALTIVNPTTMLLPRQADTDSQLLDLWLHGRSEHTQRAYRADAERFLTFVGFTLPQVTLSLVQNYADSLTGVELSPATVHRMLSAVKSLFAFGHRIGYLPFDVARPLRLASIRDSLSERILDEAEVQRMIALERNPRNHALLRLLYVCGLRVSEICSLKWSMVQPRNDGGLVTVMGKRGKTRVILIPARTWSVLLMLREGATDDQPLFRSRKGGHLDPSQVLRIVQKAAKGAGIAKAVSPHWFRHAHASHSLDRNAPISLVQQTLGHTDISTTGKYLHARPADSSSRYLPL